MDNQVVNERKNTIFIFNLCGNRHVLSRSEIFYQTINNTTCWYDSDCTIVAISDIVMKFYMRNFSNSLLDWTNRFMRLFLLIGYVGEFVLVTVRRKKVSAMYILAILVAVLINPRLFFRVRKKWTCKKDMFVWTGNESRSIWCSLAARYFS